MKILIAINMILWILLGGSYAYREAKHTFGYVCNSNGQCWSERKYGYQWALKMASDAAEFHLGYYEYGPEWTNKGGK